jgi:methylated-DNA-[protein]-cysteine S-methyltransferase
MTTPIGPLYLIASANGLKGIYWSKQEVKSVASLDNSRQEEKILDDASRQLAEYFAGTRKSFNIPFDLEEPFQIKVWNTLRTLRSNSGLSDMGT